MAERNYYVVCENDCKFPAMTKEQVLTAIEQAVTTGKIKDVDTGFVTKIKEQNTGAALSFWIGTTAEYNALEAKTHNCFYILTDDTTAEDLKQSIKELQEAVKKKETEYPPFAEIVVSLRGGSVSCTDENGENVGGLQSDDNPLEWRFIIRKYGTYTLHGTFGKLTQTKTVEATAVQQYFETLDFYSDTFADNDWQTIIDVIQKGVAPTGWNVGDTKSLEVDTSYAGTGGSVDVRIIGKNHDTYTGGGVAPFTFAVVPKSNTHTAKMHNELTTGWTACQMRTTTIPNVFIASLPAYMQTALKTVKKYTSEGNQSTKLVLSNDKAFLLACSEVFESIGLHFVKEGEQYEYYKNGNAPEKITNWLRSPEIQYGKAYGYITNDGDLSYQDAAYGSYAYFPAFCF